MKYLVYGAKNTRAKRFDLLQLGGPQNASVNFCAFLTWAERLEALSKKRDFFSQPQVFFYLKFAYQRRITTRVSEGLTSPLSRYLLMALLRRMARPLWYNTPRKNIAKQKIKLAGTPKAMPVI